MKRLVTLIAISCMVYQGYTQKQAEFTIGAGYTLIDIEGLVEEDEIAGSVATDWDQFSFGVSGQYFFTQLGEIPFGVELMYHQLYWYSVRVPFGSQDITREYYVSSFRITPLFRVVNSETFAIDVGPEFNFMDDFAIGALISGNYYIPINDKIDIPIKARLDIINGIVITVPATLHAGVRIKL